MSQSNARREEQLDEIMHSIRSVLVDYKIEESLHNLLFGDEYDENNSERDNTEYVYFESALNKAVDGALPGKMPTDKPTEQKVKLIDDMITHVETVINAPGAVDYGARKWENAIKYLIKVQVEKGWDFQVLWMFLQSEEIMFEKNKLSYGTLMANPDKMLKMWMPRAHAGTVEKQSSAEAPQYDEDGRMK